VNKDISLYYDNAALTPGVDVELREVSLLRYSLIVYSFLEGK
jgi:hypothetical protein